MTISQKLDMNNATSLKGGIIIALGGESMVKHYGMYKCQKHGFDNHHCSKISSTFPLSETFAFTVFLTTPPKAFLPRKVV